MKTNKGLYIHIPFCLQKCHYCDFYSEAGTSSDFRAKYVDAICREIEWFGGRQRLASQQSQQNWHNWQVDTVFLGGGTPSILDAEQTERILAAVMDNFQVTKDAEISMECNPATLTEKKLSAYRNAGINRLSLGVQSMDPTILKIMGRAHKPEDVIDNVKLARKAGFDNMNLDVMFGVPGQNMEIWKDTVRKVLDMEPEHLSFYSLEVAEGTEFYRRLAGGILKETAPEEDRKMYHWMLETLDKAGYEHYEISNAAKAGYQCRHNLKYWSLEDYIGIGAAAHSFIANRRFSNEADAARYIEAVLGADTAAGEAAASYEAAITPPWAEWSQENSWEDSVTDYMFTALRLVKGVEKADFAEKFGKEFWTAFADRKSQFDKHVAQGDAGEDAERIWISRQGLDIANEIIAIFL